MNKFDIFDELNNNLKKVIKSFYVFSDEKGYNVLFVTIDDLVFGFGSNDCGVCGLGHEMVVNEPQVVDELCHKGVKQFYNGYQFALALTNDNNIYGWGNNEHGQLGKGYTNLNKIFKPNLINGLNEEIIEMSCGSAHSLVLTSDGVVYGWGGNTYGQIGGGRGMDDKVSVITQLNGLPKVKSLFIRYIIWGDRQ